MNKKLTLRVLYLLVILVLATAAFATVQAQDEANLLPAPTGEYGVGSVWYHWIDESRDETYGESPQGKRELMVQILYPADVPANAEPIEYMPNREVILPSFADVMMTYVAVDTAIDPAELPDYQTHTFENVPLSDAQETYPVLIFSHGASGEVSMYTAQLEELASHGYIVVAINHPYGAAATVYPDGHSVLADFSIGLEATVPIWSQDQIFVMDQLEMLNADDPEDMFRGHLDLERLGVFGHSLGGSTTTMTCFLDARCKVGLNEDGPVFGDVITEGLDQPFMYLLAEQKLFADPAAFDQARGPFYAVNLAGFGHMNFGDWSLWPNAATIAESGWLGSIDGTRSLELTRAYLVAFFDKYLKGMEDTLLDTDAPAHPEVTITSRE